MPIQQKHPPPVLLFSDFAGWVLLLILLMNTFHFRFVFVFLDTLLDTFGYGGVSIFEKRQLHFSLGELHFNFLLLVPDVVQLGS